MSRFLLLIALAALGGCATTSSDYYRDGRYYGDAGYTDGYYTDDGYYGDGYYDGGYAGGDYYYGESYGGGYGYAGYASDYLLWPAYYSIFWPINHWYVDPYYYPGYYYGVTYFPRHYGSLSLTWGNSYRYGGGYAYGGYWDYSPYRYSWADNYYDWYPWYGRHSHHRDRHDDRPRYGSARNEAERVMALRERDRGRLGNAAYRSGGSSALSSPDRRGPRAAYYPSRQSANAVSTRSASQRGVEQSRVARDELIRSNQYRRQVTTAKPAADQPVDRYSRPAVQRGGARSVAKPAPLRSQRDSASTRLEAARDARQPRRAMPSAESSVPPRVRYSNSVRAGNRSDSAASPVRQSPAPVVRSSRGAVRRDDSYRSVIPTRDQAPAPRTNAYRGSPREAAPIRYTQPSAPAPATRSYSPPARSYSRPVVSPSPSTDSYRAPPVSSRPAPAVRSAPSSSGSSKGSKSSSSSSRGVRRASASRSGDD